MLCRRNCGNFCTVVRQMQSYRVVKQAFIDTFGEEQFEVRVCGNGVVTSVVVVIGALSRAKRTRVSIAVTADSCGHIPILYAETQGDHTGQPAASARIVSREDSCGILLCPQEAIYRRRE